MRRPIPWTALILLLVFAAACRPSGPLRVTGLQLGRSRNADNSVGGHTTQFRPDQAIYAAVVTDGPGKGSIVARWSYAGRLVSEERKDVSYNREAYTEFHIQNSGGFPPGDYRVEILLDGTEVASRAFRVQK
jgi:hypothetical protein